MFFYIFVAVLFPLWVQTHDENLFCVNPGLNDPSDPVHGCAYKEVAGKKGTKGAKGETGSPLFADYPKFKSTILFLLLCHFSCRCKFFCTTKTYRKLNCKFCMMKLSMLKKLFVCSQNFVFQLDMY